MGGAHVCKFFYLAGADCLSSGAGHTRSTDSPRNRVVTGYSERAERQRARLIARSVGRGRAHVLGRARRSFGASWVHGGVEGRARSLSLSLCRTTTVVLMREERAARARVVVHTVHVTSPTGSKKLNSLFLLPCN